MTFTMQFSLAEHLWLEVELSFFFFFVFSLYSHVCTLNQVHCPIIFLFVKRNLKEKKECFVLCSESVTAE